MLSSLIDRYKGFRQETPSVKDGAESNLAYLNLCQAKRNLSFIEVTLDSDNVIYQSLVLELDSEEQTVLIDELFPVGFKAVNGQQINLTVRHSENKKVKFKTTLLEQYHYDGSLLYVLAMPQRIETEQRRSAYRLPIGNRVEIESYFTGPDQQSYGGRVRNLSSIGVGMEIDSVDAFDLYYNDKLSQVTFDFAGININCAMKVRSITAEQDRIYIGAEFASLSVHEQRDLEKSIVRIQRERIKRGNEVVERLAMD